MYAGLLFGTNRFYEVPKFVTAAIETSIKSAKQNNINSIRKDYGGRDNSR